MTAIREIEKTYKVKLTLPFTSFQKSCIKFFEKYNMLSKRQLNVLILIEDKKRYKKINYSKPTKRSRSYYSGFTTGDCHFDYDLGLCGQN
jgi:hypothetical protein